jgi:putative membrane protein
MWINVAHPPEGAPPPGIKGKTTLTDVTPEQLRRRKVEAIHLALSGLFFFVGCCGCLTMVYSSFAFAVKHYLREEDGLNHDDYIGVLPPSFAHYDETGYNANKNSGTSSYAAVSEISKRNSQDGIRSGRVSPDATKRVRSKRSKPTVPDATTPLLHSTVNFHPIAEHGSMPLPLV